ncbi:MAG: hypothetical protein ACI9PP_002367 [Halobacteriales archaeon]|jgi:hypothetical protein
MAMCEEQMANPVTECSSRSGRANERTDILSTASESTTDRPEPEPLSTSRCRRPVQLPTTPWGFFRPAIR